MTRPPGGPATNLPRCARPGHEACSVVKDGQYGTPLRQRYRCLGEVVNPVTGEIRRYHRFVPATSRILVKRATCDTCDNHIARHECLVVTGRYQFPIREVVSASSLSVPARPTCELLDALV